MRASGGGVEKHSPPKTGTGGTLRLVRHRWAGSLLEDAVLEASPALLTVAVDAVPAVPADQPGPAAVHAYQPVLDDADLVASATESAGRAGGASLATARVDRKSTRLNSSHLRRSRMPSSA